MPDGSGFDFCEEIRKTSNVYIIMLTALDEEFNAVMGYEIGADDYVTKPFSLAILVSKVKAFMKRAGNDEKEKTSENILISEDIEFDYGDYTLILNREDTEKVQLTKQKENF